MALVRMTLEEIKAQAAARSSEEQAAFERRMAATSEAEIHRQMIEDGEDPAAKPPFAPPVLAQHVRKKLGLNFRPLLPAYWVSRSPPCATGSKTALSWSPRRKPCSR